jgi:phospholipid/cholesterol/gamma-HCH transport system substrate-binding protein
MIRLGTKIQLALFFIITVIGITYVGATYIGINPLKAPYTVHLRLPSTGGIYTNADVAERGVVIGRVGALHLAPSGVIADLSINHGEQIPTAGLTATVADLSAVGEQYLELESTTDSGPYLAHGATIASEGKIPVDDAVILRNLEGLLGSVNVHDLSTVVTELGKGFNGLGPSLQKLIDNGDALTQSAKNALPQTEQLINDGKTVLDTQRDVAAELKSFASSFSAVTGEISGKDTALRTILDNGSAASTQLATLLKDNADVLPELLTNLNTFTGIQNVRLPYTRAVLELYPAIVADSFYALPQPKGGISTARFGLVTDLGPGCSSGYQSTRERSNTPKDWGGAANLAAFCSGNNAALNAQHIDVRGARNVPRPKGDTSQVTNADPYPGPHYPSAFAGSGKVGACGTPTCGSTSKARNRAAAATAAAPTVFAAPYDPSSGVVEGLDGKLYALGLDGPLAPVFGSSSYTWLLLAPTMR